MRYHLQGDEADVPATIRVDATRTEKPEVVKDEYTELVSITEESTTTTAPPRTSFFSRLIDDIAKVWLITNQCSCMSPML